MKMMRRLIALVLAVGIVFAMVVTNYSADGFKDVPVDYWAYRQIQQAVKDEITTGYQDGTFKPTASVTYAHFSAFLARAFYKDEIQSREGEWYEPYVAVLKSHNLYRNVALKENNPFGAALTDPINRYDMATLMYAIMIDKGAVIPENALEQMDQIKDYVAFSGDRTLAQAVCTCYQLGLLTGYADGTFGGARNMNRAQACVVISRMQDYLAGKVLDREGEAEQAVPVQPEKPIVTPEDGVKKLRNGKIANAENVKAALAELEKKYPTGSNDFGTTYYLKRGMANNEDFCYFGTVVTITAHSLEELKYRFVEIRKYCVKKSLKLKNCWLQQLEAFTSTLPLCYYDPGLWKKSKRNILTSSLASTYPFGSYEMNDEDGILMGTNHDNGSLVYVDLFDTRKYNNANVAILGSSGAGKTYTLECMALRMRQRGIQVFVIAPLKGHEFRLACDAVGGAYVKIAPGSGNNINIMEIRKKEELADEDLDIDITSASQEESILMKKIQQLHVFFTLLIKDINYEEKQLLDEALIRTYEIFGITSENESLFDPETPDRYREMPILGDLHAVLKEMPGASRLYNVLTRYVSGSAKSFNQRTNVNLDNKYVVLDVSTLTDEMLPIGMFLALDYVWDKARENRITRKVVFIDETWKLVGAKSSPQAANFVLEIFKVIRGFGGSAVAATQDLNDFFALENGIYGAGIINNSKTKLLMKTEPSEADTVARVMELTAEETREIKNLSRGTCLLAANYNHTRRENVQMILRDGMIKRMGDTECWFCVTLEDSLQMMRDTVMKTGKPYYKVGGGVGHYPEFHAGDYVILKLTPKRGNGTWVHWMNELPADADEAAVRANRDFCLRKWGYRGGLKFYDPQVIEVEPLLKG